MPSIIKFFPADSGIINEKKFLRNRYYAQAEEDN